MLENNNNDDNKKVKKSIVYYIMIVTAITLLFNVFVLPTMIARQVQVIGYSDFLAMVEEGKVVEVSLTQEADGSDHLPGGGGERKAGDL